MSEKPETETPETDAAARNEYDNQGWPYEDQIVDSDFARGLERQRNDLRRILELTKGQLTRALEEVARLTAAARQLDKPGK